MRVLAHRDKLAAPGLKCSFDGSAAVRRLQHFLRAARSRPVLISLSAASGLTVLFLQWSFAAFYNEAPAAVGYPVCGSDGRPFEATTPHAGHPALIWSLSTAFDSSRCTLPSAIHHGGAPGAHTHSIAMTATTSLTATQATHPPTEWLGLSAAEADEFACHYFSSLSDMPHASWELQQPAAAAAIAVLQRLHPLHRCVKTLHRGHHHMSDTMRVNPLSGNIPTMTPRSTAHSTPLDATAALATLLEEIVRLKSLACGDGVMPPASLEGIPSALGKSDGPGLQPKLPAGGFVAVRRLTLAVLQQLWGEPGKIWQAAISKAAPKILTNFKAAQACGAQKRPTMELFHVSKSGGTSLCQLARLGTRRAQHFDQEGNCLQEYFRDEPKWTIIPPFVPEHVWAVWGLTSPAKAAGNPAHIGRQQCNVWPAYDCPKWMVVPEITCAARQRTLDGLGLDFFSNEHALHGGSAHPGSSHLCPQFESLLVVREAVQRAQSHILHLLGTFKKLGLQCELDAASRGPYHLPRNLTYWSWLAPAVLDNYYIRSLLGRHFHCRPFGSLTLEHLHHAQLKVLSFDHIVALNDDVHTDTVLRLGLGWPETLRGRRWRAGTGPAGAGGSLEASAGFPPGSSDALKSWNTLDSRLVAWAQIALKLDSSFLATAAVFENRTRPAAPHQGAQASPTAAGTTSDTMAAATTATAASTAAARQGHVASAEGAWASMAAGRRSGVSARSSASLPELRGYHWDPEVKHYMLTAVGAVSGSSSALSAARLADNTSLHMHSPVANSMQQWPPAQALTLQLLLFGAEGSLPIKSRDHSYATGNGSAAHGLGDGQLPMPAFEFICPDSSLNGTRLVQPVNVRRQSVFVTAGGRGVVKVGNRGSKMQQKPIYIGT